MVKRRKRKEPARGEDKCELSMTPMIDCVFLLLIFFMCATKFKVPDYRIDASLPRDKGLRAVQIQPTKEIPEFRITIDPVEAPKGSLRATFRIGRSLIRLRQTRKT